MIYAVLAAGLPMSSTVVPMSSTVVPMSSTATFSEPEPVETPLACVDDSPEILLSTARINGVAEASTVAGASRHESQPAVCDLAYWLSTGCRMKPRSTVPSPPDSARRLSALHAVLLPFRPLALTDGLDEQTAALGSQVDPVRLFRPPRA